jgi:hypothetical protein
MYRTHSDAKEQHKTAINGHEKIYMINQQERSLPCDEYHLRLNKGKLAKKNYLLASKEFIIVLLAGFMSTKSLNP